MAGALHSRPIERPERLHLGGSDIENIFAAWLPREKLLPVVLIVFPE